MSSSSYREAHKTKGEDYHVKFSDMPHRAMLWRMEQRFLRQLVSNLFPGRRPTYLDFACGTGRVLAHLAPLTESPVGIDVSASMLEVARKGVGSAEVIEADLTRDDPLGARQFQLITAFRFFPNAEPELRSAAIAALARHLHPEGYLVFNNHKNTASLARRVSRWLGRLRPPTDRGPGTMSRGEAYELAAEAELRILREHPIGALPFTDRHMLRPAWLLGALESALSRVPGTSAIAQNLLYVCERDSRVRNEKAASQGAVP